MFNLKQLLLGSFCILALTNFGIIEAKRSATLDKDGKYQVSWEADKNAKTIVIEAVVETTGFVGFGLSKTGGMVGADIVIGGVDPSGQSYFSDRYSEENGMPVVDASQDWELLAASENATHTILQFTRVLESCDDQDIAIQENTLKIIWSYGETDDIGYHGRDNRGAYAVNLLDPPMPEFDFSQYSKFETVMNDTMPSDDTTYWCTTYRAPSFSGKQHIVGFKPKIVSEDAQRHSHHFTLYKCKAPEGEDPNEFFAPYIQNGGGNCLTSPWDQPIVPSAYCLMFVYAWSIGGRDFAFPENLGFPIGEETDEYFMLEVHLDNPTMSEGVVVETGIEVYYTPELRPIDAGMLVVGQVIGLYQTIPPAETEFTTVGHCSSGCTSNFPDDGITLFNVMLHAHKSGRKMRLRHFRGASELPWIANDETYDFDYQDNRNVDNIKILPGDQLALECTYDTTWIQPSKTVIGGWSTRDEMCETFMYYYPRNNVEHCFSRYPETKLLERFGIEAFEVRPELLTDVLVTAPPSLANLTYSQVVDQNVWTDETKAEFQLDHLYNDHLAVCWVGITIPSDEVKPRWTERYNSGKQDWPPVTYPVLDEEYTPIDVCASKK